MSDPNDQSNMPSFGRLKKLGEDDKPANPPAPEPVAEDLPPVPENDLSQTVPPQNNPTAPLPTVPNAQPATGGGSGLKLKDRTKVHLEANDRAEESQAQFDEYFEQQTQSGPSLFTKIFGEIEEFSPKTRKIFLGVTIALFILATVLSFKTLILNFFLALITFQLIRVFSMQQKTLSRLGLFPARVIFTAIFSIIAIVVPLSYKSWQVEGGKYLQELQNVESAANEGQSKIKDAVESVEEHAEDYVAADAVVTHEFNYSAKIAKSFHDSTHLSGGGLLKMYFQYVFFLSAFLFLPFCRERDLTKVLHLRADNDSFTWKIARHFMLRLIKAFIIAVIFAVGLKYAGYESVMFVAGTTFFLTMFSQFGTILGLVLCIPVAVTQFSNGSDGWNSLIALAVMGLVAIIVEKKLHWLMVVIPMSKEGIIPASMIKPKQQIVKVDGGPSFISKLLGIVFPLAFYGVIALAGYKVYSVYNDMSEGRKEVNEALDSLPENKQAFAVMEDYREKYPADREVLLTMSKAYLKSAKVDKALELATAFRDFKEPEASSEGNLIAQGEEIVNRFLSKPRRSVNDEEAHKWLVVNYSELFKDYLQKEEYKKLAEAMLETDKEEIAAFVAMSKHYLVKKDYALCREWADKGLAIDSENVRLLCNITRTHIEENNKKEALKAMINVDKVTTSDEEAEELRKLLLRL